MSECQSPYIKVYEALQSQRILYDKRRICKYSATTGKNSYNLSPLCFTKIVGNLERALYLQKLFLSVSNKLVNKVGRVIVSIIDKADLFISKSLISLNFGKDEKADLLVKSFCLSSSKADLINSR